ncbi:hypothetical protein ES705_20572 [subsurface metagenome]
MTEKMVEGQVFWAGEVSTCQICNERLGVAFVDGRLGKKSGTSAWGIMCVRCHRLWGYGLGQGKGQLYGREGDGRYRLVVGGM